jgi:hypothetical protein
VCDNQAVAQFAIDIVQGDDFNLIFKFQDENGAFLTNVQIKEIYITCEKLNYQAVVQFSSAKQGFLLTIPAETTANFVQTVTTYDVTVNYVNGNIVTEIYQAPLNILLKRNKVTISG